MKIGILTLPLQNNYGGILQAYALQYVLKQMGHDVWILRREHKHSRNNFGMEILRMCKDVQRLLQGQERLYVLPQKREAIAQKTKFFIDKYIEPHSPRFYSTRALQKFVSQNGFEVLIVGSDQVWRPRPWRNLTNYFFDFARNMNVRRIAYAASLAEDKWLFTKIETEKCKKLAKMFDAISVREESSISIVHDNLDVDAGLVLDPTFLLDTSVYEKLINEEKEPLCDGNLFCYLLDENTEKWEVIRKISERCGLLPFKTMPQNKLTRRNMVAEPESCVFPSVTRWLRSFVDARMVITDSFHGTVFSILFNKPFWTIGNKERGMARFESLLRVFSLEHRLVASPSLLLEMDVEEAIDWEYVNTQLIAWRKRSIGFLQNSINHTF